MVVSLILARFAQYFCRFFFLLRCSRSHAMLYLILMYSQHNTYGWTFSYAFVVVAVAVVVSSLRYFVVGINA